MNIYAHVTCFIEMYCCAINDQEQSVVSSSLFCASKYAGHILLLQCNISCVHIVSIRGLFVTMLHVEIELFKFVDFLVDLIFLFTFEAFCFCGSAAK